MLGFAGGQWVEIVNEVSALKGPANPLFQIDKVDPTAREITLKTSAAAFQDQPHLKLRRWDQTGNTASADGVEMTADWIDLEGGIQVRFSAGRYLLGDYWLIPARTATGDIEWPPFEIPNTQPIPQPPLGIQHYYCRLSLLHVEDGMLTLDDCRELFPTLTDICAEDICFDNSACQLPHVETVQDALDRLCAQRDLRHHNKYLHGWGIVCGLQVVCGPDRSDAPRRHVTVRSGYAIDCEGNDIVRDTPETLDLIAMIEEQIDLPLSSPPLTSPALRHRRRRGVPDPRHESTAHPALSSGEVRPVIGQLASPAGGHDAARCLQRLHQEDSGLLEEQLTPPEADRNLPAGPVQQRLSALTNLLAQPVNPQAGQHIFISRREHVIMLDFYEKLRAILQSETFCAMFDNARSLSRLSFHRHRHGYDLRQEPARATSTATREA